MHKTVNNLISIQNQLKELAIGKNKTPTIIAVSKTFDMNNINPLILHGQIHFGENKIQEATEKWTKVKSINPNIRLHMLGKIQTNKVKFLFPLFDYIHSLDNLKLAEKISSEQIKKNFKPKIFIQVNLANETQKNGIEKNNLERFYIKCTEELNLNVIGLMCLPPAIDDPEKYFIELKSIASNLSLKELSMGMSNDYLKAASCGSSYLRIGSNIFGQRN
jgi:pyridoxal phosphate enzyme (YggS family)